MKIEEIRNQIEKEIKRLKTSMEKACKEKDYEAMNKFSHYIDAIKWMSGIIEHEN